MNPRYTLSAALVAFLVILGCSGSSNPVTPSEIPDITAMSRLIPAGNQTHLWGYYEVSIDPETYEVSISPNRSIAFTANVVKILNNTIGSITFNLNSVTSGPGYIDVDIDMSISHPFPGYPQYRGYDVRGVFIGDGSASLGYNSSLVYPVNGADQFLLGNPLSGFGAPDGYTRWYNPAEFSEGGLPLLNYTQGKWAIPGDGLTSTLCPYRYYADSLGATDDLWEFLDTNSSLHSVFSPGVVNTRNYYVRFPNSTGITYGYAIIANWNGVGDEDHPANAPEAVSTNVSVTPDLYYVSPTVWGGDLILDVSFFDWDFEVEPGVPEEITLVIESNIFNTPSEWPLGSLTPSSGGEFTSTYHVEIPAENITGLDGNEFWVILEYQDYTYENDFGVTNLAGSDKLAAFFRYPLEISGLSPTEAPVCDIQVDPCSLNYWDVTDHATVNFDASGSYDPDGGILDFHWDFDGDDIYDEPGDDNYTGSADMPTSEYFSDGVAGLKLEDGQGGVSYCTIDVFITQHQSKNIPLRSGWIARDLAVDPINGDLSILYYLYDAGADDHWIEIYKYSACDFYPEPPEAFHAQPEGSKFNRIEVSQTHYTLIGGPVEGASGKVRNITPDGVDIGPNWIIHTEDLWAFNDGGDWPLDHCTLYGWDNPPWNPGGHNTYVYRAPYATSFDTWIQNAVIYWGTDSWTGPDKLFGNHVRGTEAVASGNQFWAVKDPGDPGIADYYGTRFSLDEPGSFTGVNYDNAWFGTGSQTDDDSCWYNAMDMTRDSVDILLVLDKLSDGAGRIKAFTGDESGGTSLGGINIPDDIIDTPVRMDSSDLVDPVYGNMVYVLHGDEFAGYFLSIMFPDNLPW